MPAQRFSSVPGLGLVASSSGELARK